MPSMAQTQKPKGNLSFNNAINNNKPNFFARRQKILEQRKSLPIASVERRLIEEVRKHDILIIVGETGSGKTTQIPQFLFNAGFCRDGKSIGITQPRRVAAVTVAKRVADECGVDLGQKVGYSIRFEDVTSSSTRIKYMTDGLLLREALLDPYLTRYSVIIVDEAHERTVHTDVLLGLLKKVQNVRSKYIKDHSSVGHKRASNGAILQKENADPCISVLKQCQGRKLTPLKLIIMSASLDAHVFSEYFGGARAVHIQGRQFPVDIFYTVDPQTDYLDSAIVTIFQVCCQSSLGLSSLVLHLCTGSGVQSSSLDLDDHESSIIQEQAIAAALLFRHHQRNGSLPFVRSTSVVHPSLGSKKQGGFPRSSSTRQRSVSDPMIKPQQLVNSRQVVKMDGVETNHFVLVHGGGFGAWCWYKTMTLLEESGFKVDAVDLTGSGVSSFDTNNITSLAQYVKPLTDIFDKLEDGNKVILVGHDFGGASISFVMELYPYKIAKAVFIAAAMLTSGQSTLDMFSQQMDSNDLMRQAQIFLYANGNNNPPTAVDLDKTLLRDLFFNQSSTKDVALASVSMRPIPFAPVLEKLSLSGMNYGSIRRFYIKTQEDCTITIPLQEAMIKSNPPEQVFQLKGSDHAPFFSRPQGLHKILIEIAQIPPKQACSSTPKLSHLLEVHGTF